MTHEPHRSATFRVTERVTDEYRREPPRRRRPPLHAGTRESLPRSGADGSAPSWQSERPTRPRLWVRRLGYGAPTRPGTSECDTQVPRPMCDASMCHAHRVQTFPSCFKAPPCGRRAALCPMQPQALARGVRPAGRSPRGMRLHYHAPCFRLLAEIITADSATRWSPLHVPVQMIGHTVDLHVRTI